MEPDNATYLIEGYIGICEAMMKEFIVHGIPANAGSRDHIDERLPIYLTINIRPWPTCSR